MAIFWSVWHNFSTNTYFDQWSMFSTYTACINSNFKLCILEEHHSHTLDDLFLFVLFFQRHISIFHFGLFLFQNHLRKCDRHIYSSFLFFSLLSVSRARKHIFLFSQLRDLYSKQIHMSSIYPTHEIQSAICTLRFSRNSNRINCKNIK